MNGAAACSMGMWFALPPPYLITWLWGRGDLAWQLYVGLLSWGLLGILNFSHVYSSLRSTDLLQHLCTLNPDLGFTNQGLLGGLSSFLHDAVLPFGSWNVTDGSFIDHQWRGSGHVQYFIFPLVVEMLQHGSSIDHKWRSSGHVRYFIKSVRSDPLPSCELSGNVLQCN
jgi:hypothetical protein